MRKCKWAQLSAAVIVLAVAFGACGASDELLYEQKAWCTLERWVKALETAAEYDRTGLESSRVLAVDLAVSASIEALELAMVEEPPAYAGTREKLATAATSIKLGRDLDATIKALDSYKVLLLRAGIRDPQPRCPGS